MQKLLKQVKRSPSRTIIGTDARLELFGPSNVKWGLNPRVCMRCGPWWQPPPSAQVEGHSGKEQARDGVEMRTQWEIGHLSASSAARQGTCIAFQSDSNNRVPKQCFTHKECCFLENRFFFPYNILWLLFFLLPLPPDSPNLRSQPNLHPLHCISFSLYTKQVSKNINRIKYGKNEKKTE